MHKPWTDHSIVYTLYDESYMRNGIAFIIHKYHDFNLRSYVEIKLQNKLNRPDGSSI